jgi:RNA-binding protein YlmH
MMSIYEHYHRDEHEFVDQVVDWKQQVELEHAYKLTDFLDPREQTIVTLIIGNDKDIKVKFWGGSDSVERKRAIIHPSYYEPTNEDFECLAYQLQYPVKFTTIEHRSLLGSIMGLGVKRSKFGDVIIEGDVVQFVMDKAISDYVALNLTQVGKTSVKVREIHESDLLVVDNSWSEKTTTVSSLRLDAVLSECFKISRQKILPFIKSGQAKVNWKIVEQSSYECQIGDVMSVRGLGRSKIIAIEGKTKKDKWRIVLGFKK